MLPKQKRISRKLFTSLLDQSEKPKYANSLHFTLRAVSSPTNKAHVAVSVSKKVSKKAVVRNKIRRRAYVAASFFIKELKPALILLVAKPGSENIKGEDLKAEIKELLLKADLIV
jgi:ribonuclease P protein component